MICWRGDGDLSTSAFASSAFSISFRDDGRLQIGVSGKLTGHAAREGLELLQMVVAEGFFFPAIDHLTGSPRFMSVNVSGMIIPFFCVSMVEKVVEIVEGKQIEKHISHAGKMIGLIKWNKSP